MSTATAENKAPAQAARSFRMLHTMLRVFDLEKSLHFYTDMLGMKVLRRSEN